MTTTFTTTATSATATTAGTPTAPRSKPHGDPSWWSKEHESSWSHVRDALARDWAQTKIDLKASSAVDLNQTIVDTLQQAAGSEKIPPHLQPNIGKHGDMNWTLSEPAVRYGFGARAHHAAHTEWNGELETKLSSEWSAMNTFRSWDDAKEDVRRGWSTPRLPV